MAKFKDLTGMIFERLMVIKYYGKGSHGKSLWECNKCLCGNIKIVSTSDLISEKVKSCNCLHREISTKLGKNNKKYNNYNLDGEFGIGYTFKCEEFYFDIEDYEKIKNFCWYKHHSGYMVANVYSIDGDKKIALHKLVMNATDNQDVDHINRKKEDNKKSNLRFATDLENSRNRSIQSNNTTGIIGLYKTKKGNNYYWQSIIVVNGKNIHLCCSKNKTKVIIARLQAEKKYFGEFAPQGHLFEQYGIE